MLINKLNLIMEPINNNNAVANSIDIIPSNDVPTEDLYLDVKDVLPEYIRIYEKLIPNGEPDVGEDEEIRFDRTRIGLFEVYKRVCLFTQDFTRYHKYCGFNKFTKETFSISTIGNNWSLYKNLWANNSDEKLSLQKDIKESIFDPTSKLLTNDELLMLDQYNNESWTVYITKENHLLGFLVFVQHTDEGIEVVVYGKTDDVMPNSFFHKKGNVLKIFNQIIYQGQVKEVKQKSKEKFDIKSLDKCKIYYDANLLLLIDEDIKNNMYRYIQIGTSVFEFTMNTKAPEYNDYIVSYDSTADVDGKELPNILDGYKFIAKSKGSELRIECAKDDIPSGIRSTNIFGPTRNDVQLLMFATNFATKKHKNQRRKNSAAEPYINHPIGVSDLMSEAGIKEIKILCAGLLHDTVEDTETTKDELEQNFGPIITGFVMEVTDDKNLTKAERKRKQVVKSCNMSEGASCVKMADKLYNLMDIANDAPADWSAEYIIGSTMWMHLITNNLVKNVKNFNLSMSILELKRQFDVVATSLLKKHGMDLNMSQEMRDAILENYYTVLC